VKEIYEKYTYQFVKQSYPDTKQEWKINLIELPESENSNYRRNYD